MPLAPSDFYMKSRLQDVLSRPTEKFNNAEIKNLDLIYYDLHQQKLGHPPEEYYQTITKDRFKDFGWQTTDYVTAFAHRAERDDLFFEKSFDRSFF